MAQYTMGTQERLSAQALDTEFAPHPSEIVHRHWIGGICLPCRLIFEVLKPLDDLLPFCRLAGVRQHSNWLIERGIPFPDE
ncbi:MAG: hypothetical protein AAAC47_04020 [Pararhizobium sp.]